MINYTFSFRDIEYFLLILTRITCFFHAAPFYGMTNTPRRVKIGLGFFVSVLLFQTISPHEALEYSTIWGYSAIVLREALTGLFLGFGLNICMMIVGFSGRIIDTEIGLSMMSLMDPATKESTSITGVFFQYIVTLLLITTGMYQYILKAICETFQLIPINKAIFNGDKILSAVVIFMGEYFIIGFQICLPVFATIMLLNVVLGILAKVAPQMNMFAVGIQLKLLTGMTVLLLTIGLMPEASQFVFTEMKKIMVAFVKGMM